ncbi:MAG: EthD domain-containing protein, partial [Acidimicrobiales bacterium]
MEKVLYALTRGAEDSAAFADRLLGSVATALFEHGAHGVQVNVADAAVAPAARLRIVSSPAPADAVVSIWVDSAVAARRAPFDAVVADAAEAWAAYLVTESVPLANTRFPPVPGTRTEGLSQMAFLQRPATIAYEEWLDLWLNGHTAVALDTQDTFGYVQNVVTRVLTPGAPPWAAIVEELFPAGAMTDPHVFY